MEKTLGLYARFQHDVMEAGKTHAQIAEELQARYPGECLAQGASVVSAQTMASHPRQVCQTITWTELSLLGLLRFANERVGKKSF